MTRVAVVDSGLSNLDSIARALEVAGAMPVVTRDPDVVRDAHRVLLPGVGAFPDAMASLRDKGLDVAIVAAARAGTSVLGICLGMQLLADEGTEVAPTAGLGLVPGRIEPIVPQAGERTPHIGWNALEFANPDEPLFANTADGADVYFVHSFHFAAADPSHVIARTPYGGGIVTAVRRGNVCGLQFHPEKSQGVGIAMLRAFVEGG